MKCVRPFRRVGVLMVLVVLFASFPGPQVTTAARDYCIASDGEVTWQFGTAQCEAGANSTAVARGPNSFASASNGSRASALEANSPEIATNNSTATPLGEFSAATATVDSFAYVSVTGANSVATAQNGGSAVVFGAGSEATANGCTIQFDSDGVVDGCP